MNGVLVLDLLEEAGLRAPVACRIGGAFAVTLACRDGLVPWRLKCGIVSVLALCGWLGRPPEIPSAPHAGALSAAGLTPLLLASEVFFGCLLGTLALLVLAVARAAAQIISQQIGIGAALVVDPLGGSEGETLARLHTALALLVFFLLGLHRTLLESVLGSFLAAPPGTLADPAGAGAAALHLAVAAGKIVAIGAVGLALPVLLAMLAVSLGQGLLGRMLPEAELLVLGMPVRAIVGLLVLAASMPATTDLLGAIAGRGLADGRALLEVWTGASSG